MDGGAVYGFRVVSPLTFVYLREGDGDPLEVVEGAEATGRPHGELLFDWEGYGFHTRLYQEGATYEFWVKGFGLFVIEPQVPRITVPETDEPLRREELMWGLPALLCLTERGDFAIHAAAIEVDGRAILLAAPGSFGKSTLAAGFGSKGFRVLSEDSSCLRVIDMPYVIPGPALLRLREDVGREVEVASATEIDAGSDRVRYAIDPEARGDCTPVPLAAVALLRESEDGVWIEPAEPIQTIRDLWNLSFQTQEEEQARVFQSAADLVSTVPVFNLHRPLRLDALDDTVHSLLEHVDH